MAGTLTSMSRAFSARAALAAIAARTLELAGLARRTAGRTALTAATIMMGRTLFV